MAVFPYRSIGEFLSNQRLVRATLNPSTGLPAEFGERTKRGVSIFDLDETMTLKSPEKAQAVQKALQQKDELAQQGRPYNPGIWDQFHDLLRKDKVNPHMEDIFRQAREDHSVVMLTARGQGGRQNTIDWLRDHDLAPDALITRPLSLDGVKSSVYKEKMISSRIPRQARIHALYDDDPGVIEMASRNPRIGQAVPVEDHIPRISSTARDQLYQMQAQGLDGPTRIQTMGR